MNDIEQWRTARYGIIVDGEFVAIDNADDPRNVESPGARWIGGEHDYQLAQAVAKSVLSKAVAVAVGESASHIVAGSDSVTLNGWQLLAALDFIAPDRDNPEHAGDQLECEATIQRGDGHSGNGMYCWVTDYPDEGAMLLDSERGEQAPPAPIASREEAVPSGSLRLRNMILEEGARRVENQFGLGTVAADIRSMKFERSSQEDLSRADDYGNLPEEAVYLADEEIDIIAESMPGGIDGFLKGWGWRNFARAIEAEVLLTHPAAAQLSRAEVLLKLRAAQMCHPNAVQPLIEEAIDLLEEKP